MEPYLTNIDNKQHRKVITQLRLSSHNLNIESKQGTIQNPNDRKCNMCNLSEAEDEKHFLVTCPAYAAERKELFLVAKSQSSHTDNYDNQQWLIWLLSNENKTICKAVGKYVYQCSEIRKQQINKPTNPPLNRI